MSKTMQKATEGWGTKGLRYFLGDDAFICYARRDGAAYAAALGNELLSKNYSCKLDQWGAEPGKELPPSLIAALKRSSVLVLVSSTQAGSSSSMEQEISTFKRTRRPIVAIDIDGTIQDARWWPLIDGLHFSVESQEARQKAKPSEHVLNKIINTIGVNRKIRRQRNATALAAVLFVSLLSLSSVAGVYATRKGLEAQEKARIADEAEVRAREQTKLAEKAEAEANAARKEVGRLEGIAQEQAAIATEQTKLAQEQTKVAEGQRKAAADAKKEADKQAGIAAEARGKADEATAQQREAEAQTRESVAQSLIATGYAQLERRPEVAVGLSYEAARLSDTLDAVALLQAAVRRVPLWFELIPPGTKEDAIFLYFMVSRSNNDAIATDKRMSAVISVTKRGADEQPQELGVYKVPTGALVSKIELQQGDKLITPSPLATSLFAVQKNRTAPGSFAVYSFDAADIRQPVLEVRNAREVKFTDGGWPVYVVGNGGEVLAYEHSADGVTTTHMGSWPGMISLAVYPSAEQRALAVIEPGKLSLVSLRGGVPSTKHVDARYITAPLRLERVKLETEWGPDPAKLIIFLDGTQGSAVYALDAETNRSQEIYKSADGMYFDTGFQVVKGGRRVVISGAPRSVTEESISIIDIDWKPDPSGAGFKTDRKRGGWFEHGARSANTRSTLKDLVVSPNGNFLVANRSTEGITGLTSSNSDLEFWDIRYPSVVSLNTNGAPVKRLAFSADATRLLAWDAKGVVSVFRVNASTDVEGESGKLPPEVASSLRPKIEPAGERGRFRRVIYNDRDWRYFDMMTGAEIRLGDIAAGPIKDSLLADAGRIITIATDAQLIRYEGGRVRARVPLPDGVTATSVDSEITLTQTARGLNVYDTASLRSLYSIDLTHVPPPMWIWGEKGSKGNVWVYAVSSQSPSAIYSWQLSERRAGERLTQFSVSRVEIRGLKDGGGFRYWLSDGVLLLQTVPEKAFQRTPLGNAYDVSAQTEIRLYDLVTGEEKELTPPAGKGWPSGAGSMERFYLTDDGQLVLLLKYAQASDKEELVAATWPRSGGSCSSYVPLKTSGQVLMSSYVGGHEVAHLLIAGKRELVLLRVGDGAELWRGPKGPTEELFPPLALDPRANSWSGVITNSFQKTAQRILMAGGDSGDVFTHVPLPAALTEQYDRWLKVGRLKQEGN